MHQLVCGIFIFLALLACLWILWAALRRFLPPRSASLHTTRVELSVDVPDGRTVQVTLRGSPSGAAPQVTQELLAQAGSFAWRHPSLSRSFHHLKTALRTAVGALTAGRLFWLALLVYLATRLIGLERWPIYFFTDEAVQTVMAADFVHQDFKNYDREAWPTYFNNGATYNLSSVSVYVQVIPYLLFGKSVFVTRAVSALIGALAALAVGLILGEVFQARFGWSGVLLLSITPAWFLHSRTAFETVELTAFYALFLLLYLLYRQRNPRYLFPALFFGALVFYTYSPGALVMLVTGSLLLLSDLPYHVRHWKTCLLGLLFLGLLALPYLRYTLAHPGVAQEQLCMRAPAWCAPGPLAEKVESYLVEYARGFSPSYWYLPNQSDLDRHLMKGYGHILWFTAPFLLVGLGVAVWHLKKASYRAVLCAMLAAPAGSALVQIGITRILVMLVPVTLLTAIGLGKILELIIDDAWRARWHARWMRLLRFPWGFTARFRRDAPSPESNLAHASSASPPFPLSPGFIGILLFSLLASINFYMLGDALVNGPTWFQKYDMGGMQYGAIPLFREVKQYLREHPDLRLMVTPDWANGTDVVARFFLPDPMPIEMGSYKGYEYGYLEDIGSRAFVLIPADWEAIQASHKFTDIQVDQVLDYPNGEPGFYFVRMRYVDHIQEILETEVEARRRLQETQLVFGTELVAVKYSYLDIGPVDNLFDLDPKTLVRTMEANPFVLELHFSTLRALRGVNLTLGAMEAQVSIYATLADGQVEAYQSVFNATLEDLTTQIEFQPAFSAQTLRIEVLNLNEGVPANVHVAEIEIW